MAQVHVPPLMRDLTGGHAIVAASGRTVIEVIVALGVAYPGFRQRLMPDGQLAIGLVVAVNGHVAPIGLRARVDEESVVRFLSPLGGG